MKYFIDTEFLNYKKQPKLLGLNIGNSINTIELISIGIVSEKVSDGVKVVATKYQKDYENWLNGRNPDEFKRVTCFKDIRGLKIKEVYTFGELPKEWDEIKNYIDAQKRIKHQKEYYAISKDFNLKAAWKNEWVRENVLNEIHGELSVKENELRKRLGIELLDYTFKSLKWLINKYGKTNKQIAQEIINFIQANEIKYREPNELNWYDKAIKISPEFYGYFSAFDYVVFSQLFGDFSKYPNGFPMYFIDLKQELTKTLQNYNKIVRYFDTERRMNFGNNFERLNFTDNIKEKEIDLSKCDLEYKLDFIKKYHSSYPKQTNEHNALSDAKFNYELYKFLNTL